MATNYLPSVSVDPKSLDATFVAGGQRISIKVSVEPETVVEKSPIETQNQPADSVPRKYVHIEARAQIKYDSEQNRQILTFLDGNFDPIPGQVPIVFSDLDVNLRQLHLTASLSEEGYNLYKATLKSIDPLLEDWDKLEDSNNTVNMNTTDPPKN